MPLQSSVCLSQCLVYALGFFFVTDDYAVGKLPLSTASRFADPNLSQSHTI